MSITIALFIGSLRRGSLNRKLAKALKRLGPKDWRYDEIEFDHLPFYDQDAADPFPDSAKQIKRRIEKCDALIFVTPEYNRSVPGGLKNAIDWASRPIGENSFAGKPTLVSGASPGNISTAVAQQHLRTMLGYLDAPAMGQPEVFIRFQPEDLITDDGEVTVASTEKFLKQVMSEFAEWVKTVNSGTEATEAAAAYAAPTGQQPGCA